MPERTENPDRGTRAERLWTRGFVFLMIVQTADLFVYNMVTPIIAKYVVDQGATLAFAGVIASAFAFAALFSRPLSGLLADSLGRKALILVSIVMSCLSLLAYAFTSSFALLLCARVVHGFFYALFSTSIAAVAITNIPRSRRNEGMSWFSMAYVFASALGPASGVFITERWGYLPMFLFGAVIAAASFIFASKLKTPKTSKNAEPRKSRKPVATDLISTRCIPLALVICTYTTIWSVIITYMVLTGEDRGVSGISAFFAVNAVALVITRPIAGRLCDRKGLPSVYYPSAAFEAVAILLIAFSGQFWLFLIAAVCKALGSGTAWPSIQASCASLESDERSGVAMATFLLGTDIGYTVGPALGGVISEAFGYTTMYLSCLPILLIGVVIFAISQRKAS